jgi:hypothetical protein
MQSHAVASVNGFTYAFNACLPFLSEAKELQCSTCLAWTSFVLQCVDNDKNLPPTFASAFIMYWAISRPVVYATLCAGSDV